MRAFMGGALALACLAWNFLPYSAWAQSAPASGLESPIGKVVSATGSVTIEHTAVVALQASLPSGATQAKVGDFVYRADVVQTGSDGKLSITFKDGTAFNLSSNARMELNEFLYEPNGQSNASLFKLARGTFTFVAGQVAKTGEMKIDTTLATVGIRGTTPHVEVLEDGRVRFSTLIEEKEGAAAAGQTAPRSPAPAPRTRRSSVSPTPLTPQQSGSYDKLFNVDSKLCRNC